MTEPSEQATDLAGFAWQMGHLDYERDRDKDVEVIARRIDAALAKAWDEGTDSTFYDPESRDRVSRPPNPYRKGEQQ